jgi:hypothetical protein
MAVVTLKDLMDPLTKIQATSEASSESLDAITAVISAQLDTGVTILKKLDRLIEVSSGTNLNTRDVLMFKNSHRQTKLLEIIATGKDKAADGKKAASKDKGGGKDNKSLKEGSEALKALGGGAITLAKGLIIFNFVPKKAVSKFKDTLFDLYKIVSTFKPKELKEGAEAFKIMASSIGTFAKNLALSAILLPIGIIGINLFKTAIRLIKPTFIELGEDSKDISKGAKALDLVGTSLFSFAKGLALASLVSVVAIIGVPFLILSMLGVSLALSLVGKKSKQINRGSKALDKMGDAMKSFAFGLALFAVTTMFILMKPVILLGMVASLVLMGTAVALLGRFDKTIRKGSAALILMGIGLALFGIGYGLFAMAVALAAPSIGDVLVQVAVILGMGLAVGLLGNFLGNILQGAVAVALLGIGLAIFGFGYIPFAEATKDTTMSDVGVQGALLLMLGLEFAAAGFGALFIGAGAIAFAAVGGALILLAPGLKAIKSVKWSQADSTDLVTLLAGIKTAFLGTTNKEGGASGFFKNIGNALGSAVKGPMMLSAAAGYAAAGMALTKLSVGLKAFKSVGWTDSESTILATALTGISGAFASAGGEAASPGGVFGAIFGNAFSPNATEKGIDSVMNAGKALTGITEGLISFQKLIDKDVDFEVLGKAITDTVGIVQTAFAAIGGEGNVAQGGFFGSLLGLEQNKVEEGIDSVMNAGKALTGIVDGLTAFQTLVDKQVDFQVLGVAISDTVGFVQKAFSAVAEEGTVEAGGFFNSLFGIKKNKVKEGIDSVSGAGKVLKDIVDGLVGFQSLIDKEIDFPTLGKAISDSIGFVQEAFAAVADEGTVESGGFWGSLLGIKKNKVAEGVASVSGAGDQLKTIADALTSFAGLKNPEETAGKIKAVLGMVGQAFASIGGKDNEETDGNWFISWDENKIQKGIEAVDGAGAALTDIAAGLKAFSGDFKPEAVAASIGTLLTSIGTAFSDLYETNPMVSPQLRDFSGFIVTLGDVAEKGLLDKAADGISKIADSINKIDIDKTVAFGDLFKSSSRLSSDGGAYKALANAVEEIRDIMQEQKAPSLIERGLDALGGGDKNKPAITPEAKAASGPDPMKKLNSTLGKINSTLASLPVAIAQISLTIEEN